VTAADTVHRELRLRALLDALRSQDRALTEAMGVIERQSDAICGLALFLRSLTDVLLDNEQRAMLVSHLELTTGGNYRRTGLRIVDTLLD
jgi:hypothetical protein